MFCIYDWLNISHWWYSPDVSRTTCIWSCDVVVVFFVFHFHLWQSGIPGIITEIEVYFVLRHVLIRAYEIPRPTRQGQWKFCWACRFSLRSSVNQCFWKFKKCTDKSGRGVSSFIRPESSRREHSASINTICPNECLFNTRPFTYFLTGKTDLAQL